WLVHLEPCIHFPDLRGLLFDLGGEDFYVVLLLRDDCVQTVDFEIEHGLPGAIGNGLGPGAGRFTRISDARSRRSKKRYSAQPSIGIDEYHAGNVTEVVNVLTIDVADIADVIFLTKATVHTRLVANDDIVVDDHDPGPGRSAYRHVIARSHGV